MLVDPGTPVAGSTVTGAIRQASQATGTSFSYLLATAQVESGLNPRAGASSSSARGLFQFVEQTWLGTLKQSGAALGYGRYADAITKTGSGYQVNDPTLRSQILKLRNDPTANAVMAGAFTQANAAYLTQQLGRSPSEGELYIAHFLGAGGAARLISQAASNPNAKAADLFPGAAQANPSIFYDRRTGAARSVAQVRDALTGRYAMARSQPQALAATAQADATPLSAPVSMPLSLAPDTAGITSAFAAAVPVPAQQDNQIFHGLFADADRGGPVASVVSRLWTEPLTEPPPATAASASTAPSTLSAPSAATAPGAAAPPPPSVTGGLLDLFRDPGRGT